MANTRVRSRAIALFATGFFVGGPLLAQAPTTTGDVHSEVSKFQDIELRLVRFRISGKEIVIPSNVTITLTFHKEGQISGRSAVNRYGGVFTAKPNGKIAVKLATATQMAGPPELMELERKYFDSLSHVTQIFLKSDRIILENERTSVEFAFSRAR